MKKIKTLVPMTICVCSMCMVACQVSSEESELEQTKIQEQTQVKEETQTTKGMTKAEQEYFAQAQPSVEQIITETANIRAIVSNTSDVTEWKEAIPSAKNCITLGEELQNLQGTKETNILSELVQLFGYTVKHGNENFIEGLETGNVEKLQDWLKINMPDIIAHTYEVSAYVQEGKTIQEQLKEEMKGILSEKEIEHIVFTPKALIVFFQLEGDETNTSLMRIYEILKFMETQRKYDYLGISFKVDYTPLKEEEKIYTFMEVTFKNQTRQEIDFNAIEWTNIPDLANEYYNQLEGIR